MTADSPITPEYASLRDSLMHAGTVLTLPDLHGGICGALCAGGPVAAQRWLDEALAEEDAVTLEPLHDPLRELVRSTWRTLDDAALAFEPLLPDDESPLEEQVQALAAWTQGFLAGLGESAPEVGRGAGQNGRNDPAAPAGIDEILSDFAEISRAGLTDEDAADRDQADFALAELREYVRVSVQIVFEELAGRRAETHRDVH